jgi:hypothetical protein
MDVLSGYPVFNGSAAARVFGYVAADETKFFAHLVISLISAANLRSLHSYKRF